jgi:hypothetical protein
MNECLASKAGFIHRHDAVLQKMVQILRRSGHTVVKEPWLKANGKSHNPDLIAMKDGKAILMELTIPFDRHTEYLDRRQVQKTEKYQDLGPAIKSRYQGRQKITQTLFSGLVIGARGTITNAGRRNWLEHFTLQQL